MVCNAMQCCAVLAILCRVSWFYSWILILTISFHISDINECVQTPAPCHALANCIDTEGSFTCTCKTGYTGDGISFCVGKKLKWI